MHPLNHGEDYPGTGAEIGIGNSGGQTVETTGAILGSTNRLTLFTDRTSAGGQAPPSDVAALFIADSMPTAEERAAIRAWAQDGIPI